MHTLQKILGLFVFILFTLFAQALQAGGDPAIEMADKLRASGKIYVVVAVLAIIFAGIIVFLVTIDRRLRKLENEQQQQP